MEQKKSDSKPGLKASETKHYKTAYKTLQEAKEMTGRTIERLQGEGLTERETAMLKEAKALMREIKLDQLKLQEELKTDENNTLMTAPAQDLEERLENVEAITNVLKKHLSLDTGNSVKQKINVIHYDYSDYEDGDTEATDDGYTPPATPDGSHSYYGSDDNYCSDGDDNDHSGDDDYPNDPSNYYIEENDDFY